MLVEVSSTSNQLTLIRTILSLPYLIAFITGQIAAELGSAQGTYTQLRYAAQNPLAPPAFVNHRKLVQSETYATISP